MIERSFAKITVAIGLGLLLLGLAARAGANEPFGLATTDVTQGPLWVTWRDLQAKLESDRRIVAQCRTEPRSCASQPAQRFIAIVGEGTGYDGLARIGRINRAVNFAIRPADAAAGPTAWTSPLDALAAGAGDCKQYAVLKYAALQEAGVAPDDLRLVIVRTKALQTIKSMQSSHVVVAVRNDAQWFILDNRSLALVESGELLDHMLPLFTLGHRGVGQFAPPSGPVAAAPPCQADVG